MINIFEYYNKDTWLAHHGILGQKWGIRRYQNKDGSLTEAGKKRYRTQDGGLTEDGKKKYTKVVQDLYSLPRRYAKGYNANVEKKSNKLQRTIYDFVASNSNKEPLKSITDKAKKISVDNGKEFMKWVKETGLDKKLEGIDSWSNAYYNDFLGSHPDAEKKEKQIASLYYDYHDAASKYYKNLFGDYANTPLENDNGTWTVADFYAARAKDHFYDILADES